MKIKAEDILQCLDNIRTYTESMVEGAREWCPDETTRNMIGFSVEQIHLLINTFKAEHLVEIEPIDRDQPAYLKEYDRVADKEEKTSGEVRTVYMTHLYSRMIQELSKLDISAVKNEQLQNWIESYVVCDKFDKSRQEQFYSKEWFYTSIQVLEDVTKKIIRDRERTPQQSLFK
jgi:hypothetical protein